MPPTYQTHWHWNFANFRIEKPSHAHLAAPENPACSLFRLSDFQPKI
jgi:hypothetical protein